MKHDYIKNLRDQIKTLQIENECLQKGITMREEINDELRKDKDTQIYIIKHLTYLILYMAISWYRKEPRLPSGTLVFSSMIHPV